MWSFVITCTSLFFGDDMVAPLSLFFVGCGEHGRVVETGRERCFLQCFCYKICISLWMVIGTTWFHFLCVVIIDSVCHWFFRFDITHVVGVLVCVWSSSTGLHIELEVAIYGLVMLLAWVFWCLIPLRYGWLDELAFVVDAIFNLMGLSVGLDQSIWLLFWLMFYLIFWRMTSQFCWAKKLMFLMLLCSSWAQWSGGSVCSLCFHMDLMLVLFGQVSSWSTRAYVMIYVVSWMAMMI